MAYVSRQIAIPIRGESGSNRSGGDGFQIIVEAEVDAHLAIHPTVEVDRQTRTVLPPKKDDWTVTHVGSGRIVTRATSRKNAKRIVKEVQSIADWQSFDGQPDTVPDGDLRAVAVRARLAELRRAGIVIGG